MRGTHDYANKRYQKYDCPEEWLDDAEEVDEWLKDNEGYIYKWIEVRSLCILQ